MIENLNPAVVYRPIHCALDDRIPFQEGFVVFYVLWYVCIVGMHLYTAAFDRKVFYQYTRFLIISMSVSTAIFLLFPTCQNLRPAVFPRENFLTDTVKLIYSLDTNTNVFPSEHVIGAIGVWLAAVHCSRLRRPLIMAVAVLMVLICLSTVFLKQHSLLDGLGALPVCAIGYYFSFGKHGKGPASV